MEEASARSYNQYIIALPRSGSTGEYSVLGFCIGHPYGRTNTASLEPNILLYCPPTCAIVYIYTYCLPIQVLIIHIYHDVRLLKVINMWPITQNGYYLTLHHHWSLIQANTGSFKGFMLIASFTQTGNSSSTSGWKPSSHSPRVWTSN